MKEAGHQEARRKKALYPDTKQEPERKQQAKAENKFAPMMSDAAATATIKQSTKCEFDFDSDPSIRHPIVSPSPIRS
jgi:hypothetical protein